LKTTVVAEQVNTEVAEDVVMVKSNVTLKKKPVYDFFKRCFDIATSLLFCIFFAIPMALIALVIVKKDKGTPFYKQERVGKNGKRIGVYKFRSMKIGADNLEETLTQEQLEEYKKE
jgi:lipopolysaccharide/colanic/teichoic acid biosynthesis glycosyltransferase